jgi:hypothetical protein
MNIIIITCPKLSAERLATQVSQLNNAIAGGRISRLEIICMNDSEAFELAKTPYKPENWNNDICLGWNSFQENIITQLGERKCEINEISPTTYLPPRKLSHSEHSVALRHLLAIKAIACGKSPCLVLEDDALIKEPILFQELVQYLSTSHKPRLFYDLTDSYIPIRAEGHKVINVGNLKYCCRPIAITRTLMAYSISPEMARLFLDSIKYYSLPIDMQIQVLLTRLCIPGVSLVNSPFAHGSKSGQILSSVYQS